MKLAIIQQKIFEVRGQSVMLDFDLAELYGVETKRLNEQVKRNMDRFPPDFMFRLNTREWKTIWSQIATTSLKGNSNRSQNATISKKFRAKSYLPYAFTEHGVTMLANVLKSKKAIKMSPDSYRDCCSCIYFFKTNGTPTQRPCRTVRRIAQRTPRADWRT